MTVETGAQAPRILSAPLLDDLAGDVAPIGRERLVPTSPLAVPPPLRLRGSRLHLTLRNVLVIVFAITVTGFAALAMVVFLSTHEKRSRPALIGPLLSAGVEQIGSSATRELEQLAERRRQMRLARQRRARRRAAQRRQATRREAMAGRIPEHAAARSTTRQASKPPRHRVTPPKQYREEEFPF
jgi:hypothetical protein